MPPDLKNRTWLTAYDLRAGAPAGIARSWIAPDVIDLPYASRWYFLDGLDAGDDITVTLTLPPNAIVDYTLLGYTDIRAKADQILALRSKRGALDADDMDSDDMDSDDMDSDDMDSDDMDSDDMDSDDMDSDDMDSDDMDSDDMDSDDMDSGEPNRPLFDQYKDVYGSAQRHALRAASVTPGPADEQIHMTARAGGGRFYFRVRGHHGASDPQTAFAIAAVVAPANACPNAVVGPWTAPAMGCLPTLLAWLFLTLFGWATKSTLILTHTRRASLAVANNTAFLRTLNDLAGTIGGTVHDLADDPRFAPLYQAWDAAPMCVPQANNLVESIRSYVESVARWNRLRYIVIVGGDDVIPFARVEDRAEISREWKWWGPYARRTPLDAALIYGFYLSDDPYGRQGALDPRGKNLRTPGRAVGRLVETAADVTAYIAWFRANRTALTPITTALVTGYTFVGDLATNIARALGPAVAGGGGVNVDATLVRDDWFAAELAEKILGRTAAGAPVPNWRKSQIIAAQGHYSANTLVPARPISAKLRPDDPAIQQADLAGVLWMTIGCHSGHNIVDPEAGGGYQGTDSWAETLLRKGATLVGGTGYQYGESLLPENSERLYTYLAQEIAAAKAVAVGDALIAAKGRYLGERVQIRGIDQKLLDVATLYGLPMLHVGVAEPRPRQPVISVPGSPAPQGKGVARRTLELTGYAFNDETGPTGQWTHWSADLARNVVARALKPVLPGVFRDITVPGTGVVGVLWTDGHYQDFARTPIVMSPVTEEDPLGPPQYRSRALLPVRPFRIARSRGTQTFVFAPLQVQLDAAGGRSRRWRSARFTIYYSSGSDPTAIQDAPGLEDPLLVASGAGVDVSITARHYGSLTEDVHVYASFAAPSSAMEGDLRTEELDPTGPSSPDGNGYNRPFAKHLSVAPADLAVFFQAVGGNGRVSALANGGRLFRVAAPGAARATQVALQVSQVGAGVLAAGAGVGYRERIELTARLTFAAGVPGNVANADVLLRLGASRIWARTDVDGIARIGPGGARRLPRLTVATRPRSILDIDTYAWNPAPTSHLVVATFPGMPSAAPSAASPRLRVDRAGTRIVDLGPSVLQEGTRVPVCRLVHVGRGRLGERRLRITRGDDTYGGYTDPDGQLWLEPSDIGSPHPGIYGLNVTFDGDARYQPTALPINVTVQGGVFVIMS